MTLRRPIMLDLSRLLMRASQLAPTGIDRVELAYAEYLLAYEGDRVVFAARHSFGHLAVLPRAASQRFVQMISGHWKVGGGDRRQLHLMAQRLLHGSLFSSSSPWSARALQGATYLNVSHHHLNRPRAIERLKEHGVRFVCLVHDLIPLQLPEYVRPRAAERHRRRIETVARLSDGIIVNSQATRGSLAPYLGNAGRAPPVVVSKLGVSATSVAQKVQVPEQPYFVCLGTIEPRKNHLLLLNIWRRFAEHGCRAPRLLIAGRRGWENENVLDMMDRCSALSGLIQERRGLSDEEVHGALGHARALLFPSFAEGYGLPLAETLALGVPALCSDLPVLREVGGDVPEYLDPLDGVGWMQTILAYAADGSPARAAQLERLKGWHAPSWDGHVRLALDLIDYGLPPPHGSSRSNAGSHYPKTASRPNLGSATGPCYL